MPAPTCNPVDTTPGDTFGGLGTDGLTEYREEEIPRLVEELKPAPAAHHFGLLHFPKLVAFGHGGR